MVGRATIPRALDEQTVAAFSGLDLRRLPSSTTPDKLLVARNVDLKTGGGLATRPQLRLFATVASNAIGLYSVGTGLRCAIPQPVAAAVPQAPPGMRYDVISNGPGPDGGEDGSSGDIVSVANVAVWQNRPYLSVLRETAIGGTTFKHEHHFGFLLDAIPFMGSTTAAVFTATSDLPDSVQVGASFYYALTALDSNHYYITAINRPAKKITLNATPLISGAAPAFVRPYGATIVDLPFAPGGALILAAEKLWANDISTNDTWFSSTINGPTDWVNPGDAGYLPTSRHVSGAQVIEGYGIYNSQLTVFYNRAMQVWQIGADPATHAITGNVGGAGTEEPRSVANVMGDVFYFSQGGFRSVKATVVTGQLKEADIGAPIQQLTKSFDPNFEDMVSIWSETRSQYISITGTIAYVYTYSPVSDIHGWTTWELPWEVSSAVEVNGELYFRRAGTAEIYVLDESFTQELGFTWTARPAYANNGNGAVKNWVSMQLNQSGDSHIYAYDNVRRETATPIVLAGASSGATFTSSQAIPGGVLVGASATLTGYEKYPRYIDSIAGQVITFTDDFPANVTTTININQYAPIYLGHVSGFTEGIGLFAIGTVSNRISLEFRGTQPWELEAFTLQFFTGKII